MFKELDLLNEAYYEYNLDNRYQIEDRILSYIGSRILENKNSIQSLIEALDEKITFSDILKTFNDEANLGSKFKDNTTIKKLDNGFVYGYYRTSVGNIVVEEEDTLEVLKYFVKAIKSRNSIVIADREYDEISLKSALLVIFCEAISKFGLSKNLIMLVPFEECSYEGFDKVIDNDKQVIKSQKEKMKFYLYLQDEFFRDIVNKELKDVKEQDLDAEIIEGDFKYVIDKINYENPKGAVIYTKDAQMGYNFLNSIKSSNVFINSSLLNYENLVEEEDKLFRNKKIMYPLTQGETIEKTETPKEEKVIKEEISGVKENLALTIKKENPWYKKIFDAIKRFLFGKNK